MTRRFGTGGVAAVFVAAIALAGGGMATRTSGQTTTREYAVKMRFWKATVAGVPTIAVTNLPADAIAYEGETVVFRVTNESPIPEGFAIDAYGIKETLKPKESKTVRVANVRPGAFVIYCQLHPFSVHYTGTLLVLPKP